MLISKLDLYKTEWLELVFDDRNKAYGAYELRQHNGRTMVTAMGIAVLCISIPLIIVSELVKPVVAPITQIIRVIPIHNIVIEHPQVAQPSQPHAHVSPPPAAAAPHAVTNPLYVPVATPTVPIQPARVDPVTPGEIGPLNQSIDDGTKGGTGTTPGAIDKPGTSGGAGTGDAPFSSVEKMPEPYGGASAWAKFLQKHLKYTDMAADAHMQGKVFVSFIVEKDGHLSNITVDRGIGYGLDEEALRVLKLSPAWKPGIQNGQPVRVRYSIPINFKLGDDD